MTNQRGQHGQYNQEGQEGAGHQTVGAENQTAAHQPEGQPVEQDLGAEGVAAVGGNASASLAAENLAAEWKAKAMLLAADMENLRKRTAKELEDSRKFALVNFARDLLAVQDNMTRALAAAGQENADLKTLQEGVGMVAVQLEQTFTKFGVEKVKTVGEKMNPEVHQVMAELVDETAEPGTVVQEMQAGYTLNGRLLRPAMVATAKAS